MNTNGIIGEVCEEATAQLQEKLGKPVISDNQRALKQQKAKREHTNEKNGNKGKNGSKASYIGTVDKIKHSSSTSEKARPSSEEDLVNCLYELLIDKTPDKKAVREFLRKYAEEINYTRDMRQGYDNLLGLVAKFNNVGSQDRLDVGIIGKVQPVRVRYNHTCLSCKRNLPKGTHCATGFKLTKEAQEVLEEYNNYLHEVDRGEVESNGDSLSIKRLPKARIWICSKCMERLYAEALLIEQYRLEAEAFDFDVED